MAFRIRKIVKKVGRLHAKVFTRVVKGLAPALSAVASVYAGPAAGAGVTLALAGASTYASKASNRGKHWTKQQINQKARSLRKQVLKYGLLGTGVGAITAAVAGGSITAGLTGLGSQTFSKFGLGGGLNTPTQGPFGEYNPPVYGSQLSSVGGLDPETHEDWSGRTLDGGVHDATTVNETMPTQVGSHTPSWLSGLGNVAKEVGVKKLGSLINPETKLDQTGHKGQNGPLQDLLEAVQGAVDQRPGGVENGAPGAQDQGFDPLIKWGFIAVAGYVGSRLLKKKAG